jgi:hypothetical protein
MAHGETRDGSVQVRPARLDFRAVLAAALAAVALTAAGCNGFGDPKAQQQAVAADPNAYPTNYRIQIIAFLRQTLTDRSDFRGALISQPVLKPVGDNPHYVVCLQFNGHSQIKNKVAIYLGGQMNEFIDSTPAECGDAVYQPFKDLEAALPPQ